MAMRLSELQCREVICMGSGTRLGFVSDVVIGIPEGEVCSLVVPGQGRMMGLIACREEYIIPWNCIRKIGPDIVLVDIKPDECRMPRSRWNGREKGCCTV